MITIRFEEAMLFKYDAMLKKRKAFIKKLHRGARDQIQAKSNSVFGILDQEDDYKK